MTTKISADNIQPTTLATIGGGPKISQILICDSSYTTLDDTAISLNGGYIKIIGSGFKAGATVTVNKTAATSVTFISATELRAQVNAQVAGSYILYVVNSDGGVALRVNGLTYSSEPTWVSGGALGGASGATISIQLSATGASTYSVQAGSTLPAGLTLSSSGLLSGTITVSAETLYNFNIVATDIELQDSPKSFSITISAGDQYFNSTTLLLSGNANTFVKDLSANNFALTVVGDTKPNKFNPYLTAWSNQFDGTGDYLTVPGNSAFNLSSGDWTIEYWFYSNAAKNATHISQGEAVWRLSLEPTNVVRYYVSGVQIDTPVLSSNTWHHIALVKSGSTTTLYANGISGASTTTSPPADNTATIYISTNPGAVGGWDFNGYISNLRIVKGTAVYTAKFTPSTQPLTAIAGTSLLTCADNRFIDDSTNNFVITSVGNTKVQSFSPFIEPATTNGSAYFDGTGDYLTLPTGQTALQPGAGDFTIEFWYNISAAPGGYLNIFSYGSTGDSLRLFFYSTNSFAVFIGVTLTISPSTANNSVVINAWNHVALVRSGTTLTLYVNGVSVSTKTGNVTNYTGNLNIGYEAGQPPFPSGYISNFRIVKGTAVYTAAFTPPAQPLTAVAGTSLLTLQNNTPQTNSVFLDASSNNLLVNRNGNSTQGTFSPYSQSGWSNYFDGTGDYLTHPEIVLGTTFTIEFWAYKTNTSTTYAIMLGNGSASWFSLAESGMSLSVGGSIFTYAGTFSLNTWNHIAIVNNAAVLSMFINGIKSTTTTNGISAWSQSAIGQFGGTAGYPFAGYISNLRIINGTALYTTSFTPPIQPLTAITNTSLLTCADNRFLDESPKNLILTKNGDTKVTNFSPFKAVAQTAKTYSNYFNGTDRIRCPAGAAFAYGTGAFTIEAWINTSAHIGIIYAQAPNGANYFMAYLGANGALEFRYGAGGGTLLATPTGLIPLNTWTHVAWVREGTGSNQFKIYINGVVALTNTISYSFDNIAEAPSIGNYGHNTSDSPYYGYISNLRVVKGTAVYTANFTPSTEPLSAITNTSLLTCQSATFSDNSDNKFAITVEGNTRPSTVNPFGSTFVDSTGYTATEYSGSMYFDSSGDYLDLPSNTALSLPGNFTVEAWVYLPVTGALTGFVSTYRNNTQNGTLLGMNGSNLALFRIGNDNGGFSATDTVPLPVGAWTHLAGVRNGSSMTLYKNGISVASIGGVNIACDNTIAVINSYYSTLPGYSSLCYISDARIVKGQTLYTSNFIPPLAPIMPVANTALLLNGTSAAITDATTKNNVETVGDTKISAAVSKFNGSSMSFDGTGDYLNVADNSLIELGNGNFTIEGWFNWTANSGNWTLFYKSSSYELKSDINRWVWQLNGTSNVFITSWTPTLSTWYHIALVRNGTTTTLYVDGTSYTSGASVDANDNTNLLNIAANPGVSVFNGYMQDFRITKGIARYTANFTAPTSSFSNR